MKKIRKEFHRLSSSERLYQGPSPLIGLTGGIATGKSTVSKLLDQKGIKVIDADQLVKAVYATEEALTFIKDHFPQAVSSKGINFKILREIFFSDIKAKQRIESFIYQRLPQAFKETTKLIEDQDFLIYDVPLLFEKKLASKMDLSIVVYASRDVQKQRLMARDQISEKLADSILSQQMDIEEKKNKADFVIVNEGTFEELSREVEKLIKKIIQSPDQP